MIKIQNEISEKLVHPHNVHSHKHLYTHVHIHIHLYTHVHTHIHIYIYTLADLDVWLGLAMLVDLRPLTRILDGLRTHVGHRADQLVAHHARVVLSDGVSDPEVNQLQPALHQQEVSRL